MPLVHDKLITPEDALKQGLCPECGRDLKLSNPIAELASHWKSEPPLNKSGDKARERSAMLRQFITDNKIRTSNQPKPAPAEPAPLP